MERTLLVRSFAWREDGSLAHASSNARIATARVAFWQRPTQSISPIAHRSAPSAPSAFSSGNLHPQTAEGAGNGAKTLGSCDGPRSGECAADSKTPMPFGVCFVTGWAQLAASRLVGCPDVGVVVQECLRGRRHRLRCQRWWRWHQNKVCASLGRALHLQPFHDGAAAGGIGRGYCNARGALLCRCAGNRAGGGVDRQAGWQAGRGVGSRVRRSVRRAKRLPTAPAGSATPTKAFRPRLPTFPEL